MRRTVRPHRYLPAVLVSMVAAFMVTAVAAGLPVASQRLTVSESATSVPCVEQISIINFEFTPSSVTVTAGCSVRWTNTVTTNHTSTNDTAPPTWDSGNIGKDQTFTRVFNATGTFPYFCKNHKAAMNASVIVE